MRLHLRKASSMYNNNEQLFIIIISLMMLNANLATTFKLPKNIPWNQTESHSIELVRPRFTRLIYEKSSLQQQKPCYLMTFQTKKHAFYAFLYRTTIPLVEKENEFFEIQCDFYQGKLITPKPGFVAVTICSDHSDRLIMNSAILMETEEKIVIRPVAGSAGSESNRSHRITNYIDERKKMPIYKTYELESDNSIRLGESFPDDHRKNNDDDSNEKINLDAHLLYWVPSPKTVFHLDRMENEQKNRNFSDWHERFKRQTTRTETGSFSNKVFNIETIIFVDRALVKLFNGNRKEVRKLILAIMNEVQLIYNFDTLKTRIRIMIQKIVYLDDRMDAPDTANGNIDQYLDSFCSWQKRLWRQMPPDSRWDHALMLTGLDLYKQMGSEKNRKVLGLAWVNGMCRPSYSCTLNEGKNFESAFVIAHELAHSLGMLHDGHDNNCEPDKYIMSERTGPGKIHWSPCSNLYLENFLRKTNLKCLERTSEESFILYTSPLDGHVETPLPGEQYSLNQQCQLALGNDYRAYVNSRSPFNDICKELWCFHGSWASPAHPALEGSKCGPGKTCSQGTCTANRPNSDSANSYRNKHNILPNDSGSSIPERNISSSIKSSASSSGTGTFMRKVQRFLRSTIRSIVRLFS